MINFIEKLNQRKMLNPLIIAVQFFLFSLVVLWQDFFVGMDFFFMPVFYETVIPILMFFSAVLFTFATLKRWYKLKRACLILLQVTFTPYVITFLLWFLTGHLSTTWILALVFYLFVLIEALTGVYDD